MIATDRVEVVVPLLVDLLARLGDRPQRRALASGSLRTIRATPTPDTAPTALTLDEEELADVVRGLALAVTLAEHAAPAPHGVLVASDLFEALPRHTTDEAYATIVADPEYRRCVDRSVPVLAAALAAAPDAARALGALAAAGPVFGTALACGVMVAGRR